jgi:hypothetical protein
MRRKKEFIIIALLISSMTSFSSFAVAEPANVYTITATANVNGSISPTGAISVVAGGNQSIAITPDPDYQILSVIVDGANKGDVNTYTFYNVQANHTIAASFKRITYTITATAEANGAISSPGVNTVNPGGSMTLTITPNAGYRVADVLVDGVSAGVVTAYTFTKVTASHTIRAKFAENEWYFIDASAGVNGSISPSGRGSVLGGRIEVYHHTSSRYRVADVAIDVCPRCADPTPSTASRLPHHQRVIYSGCLPITASVTTGITAFLSMGASHAGTITVNRGDSQPTRSP